MSDTPRTDAAERAIGTMDAAYYAQPVTQLARTLERELAEALAKLDDATLRVGRLQGHKALAEARIAALREALIAVMLEWVNGRQVGDGVSMTIKQQVVAAMGGDVPSDVHGTLRCPKCMGTGGPPQAVAFINTGEDYRKHEQRLVDGRCKACGGTGKVNAKTLERLALAEGQRRARVAMSMSLQDAARQRGISAAELSAIEHAQDLPPTNSGDFRCPDTDYACRAPEECKTGEGCIRQQSARGPL